MRLKPQTTSFFSFTVLLHDTWAGAGAFVDEGRLSVRRLADGTWEFGQRYTVPVRRGAA